MSRWGWKGWLVCALVLLCIVPHAPGQTRPSATQNTLEFRRVYVPVDRYKELTSGYLPLATQEFQDLLATINAAPSGPGGGTTRLAQATYRARLDQHDLVEGQAELIVEHENTEQSLLNLEPCTLAITSSRWKSDRPTPARIGMDAAGKMVAVVEAPTDASQKATKRRAELLFSWSLRGARDPAGALVFDLQTPACPTSSLELTLPVGTVPTIGHGLVEPLTGAGVVVPEGQRLWRIALGGRTRDTLTLHPPATNQRRERLPLLSIATTYQLTPEALDTSYELKLDISSEPLRQIKLRLDSPLRVTSVRMADKELPWNVASEKGDKSQSLVIEFPEPLSGHDRIVRIDALTPLVRDETWQLPRALVDEVIWQEGSLALQVNGELELCDVVTEAARQIRVGGAAAPRTGEVHQYQYLAADAALRVLVSRKPAHLSATEGLTLKWDGPQLSARLVSQFSASAGVTHRLRGSLPPGWVVDSVDSVPPGMLEDWSLTEAGERGAQLDLRLARAIAPQQTVQIQLLAHRRAPQRNEILPTSGWRIGDWQEVKSQRRLIAVQTESQQQLSLSGDMGLERLDPRGLSEADRALVDATSSRLVFLDASAGPEFTLALRSETPRFAANSITKLTLGKDSLSEEYQIHVRPDATPISRFVVRFSNARPQPVTWKLSRDVASEWTARRITTENAEVWEFVSSRPQTMPLKLSATRQTTVAATSPPLEAPLVSVNEADTQYGDITIATTDGVIPVVVQQGLKPRLAEVDVTGIRASYRYEPGQQQQLKIGQATTKNGPVSLWAWRCDHEARLEGHGQAICLASYALENAGHTETSITLPTGASLRQLTINGHRQTSASSASKIVVALPAHERFIRLELEYVVACAEPAWWTRVELPAPEVTFPVLEARQSVWLAPTLRAGVARDAPGWQTRLFGPLARRAGEGPPSLFSLADWRRDVLDTFSKSETVSASSPLPVPGTPWSVPATSFASDLSAAGWTNVPFATIAGETLQLQVYEVRAWLWLGWGIFLAVTGVAAWLAPRHWRWYALAVGLVSLAALWLPAPVAPLTTATLLGIFAGGSLALLLPRRATLSADNEPSSTVLLRHVASASASIVVVTLGLCWIGRVSAQPDGEEKSAPEAYRVLVPVDDKQQPTGAYVYLPRPFYDALSRAAKQAKSLPQGWIIYEASYRGRLQAAMVDKQLQFTELVATYDFEVFQANATVTIGLGRENVQLLNDRVNLEGENEGKDVRIEWLESGEGFTLPVAKPGRYRLEVALRPTARVSGPREEIDLRIPRVAKSQLLLKAPPTAAGVQVAGAQGHAQLIEPGDWRVDLGPAPRLTVYWPSGKMDDKPAAEVEASQLLWWKIRPGAVVLEAQWKFRSTGQPLTEVRLIADPRLRLLPLKANQPVAEQSIREGDVQAIHFTLTEPHEREVTLQASFSLVGATGVGQLSLPRLEAVVDKTTRRWLAVTASGVAEFDNVPPKTDALTPAEFATAWGEMEPPQLALRLLEGAAPPIVKTQPRATQITGKQALTYVIDAEQARAELEAIVTVTDGPVFQYPLRLPPGWFVDQATIGEADNAKAIRVAHGVRDRHMLFLPSGTSGEHRIKIAATGPSTSRKEWSLPQIGLMSPGIDPATVFLERTPHARVTLLSHEGYEQLAENSTAPNEQLRRIAVLRPLPNPTKRELRWEVERVGIRMQARQMLTLERIGSNWQAIVDVECRVDEGEVETLRFDVPGELSGAKLDLPAKLRTIAVPGQTRQQWIAHLDQPQREDFHARLTVPLVAASAERLIAPEIRLLDANVTQSYVVVPSQTGEQQLLWDTRGLQTSLWPAGFTLDRPKDTLVYLAPSGRYQASVKRYERLTGVPQVPLAEITIVVDPARGSFGVASFDLRPAGLTSCRVHLPPGERLLQATIAGNATIINPLAEQEYELLLHHSELPQQIDVVFSIDASGLAQLQAPTLLQLPVQRTLWKVVAGQDSPARLLGSMTASGEQQRSLRLKNKASLLQHAEGLVLESDAAQGARWLAQWRQQLDRLQTEGVAAAASDSEAIIAWQAEIAEVGDNAELLAERWNISPEDEEHFARLPLVTPASALLARNVEPITASYQSEAGPPGTLNIQLSAGHRSDIFSRILVSAVIVLLCGACLSLARWPIVSEGLAQSPHLVGVAIGIGWWLLLSPAWIGLLLAVLFGIAAWRWTWPAPGDLSQ